MPLPLLRLRHVFRFALTKLCFLLLHALQMYGFLMLLLYICSDSFTAQWQDKIYKKYPNNQIDQYQMMFGVNCSAIIITISMLIIGNDMPAVIQFLIQNPNSLVYNIITAVTSASGQMFIFYTIKSYGPVVFTIIMTTRQVRKKVSFLSIRALPFLHPIEHAGCQMTAYAPMHEHRHKSKFRVQSVSAFE